MGNDTTTGVIRGPMEFLLAVTGWWHAARRLGDAMPPESASNPYKALMTCLPFSSAGEEEKDGINLLLDCTLPLTERWKETQTIERVPD